MGTYFEYRTINELIGNNCNIPREQKEFTLDELLQYDGKDGRPAYIAIEGIVYDVSNESIFRETKNIEIIYGKDLTEQFNFYYRINQIIDRIPRMGVLDNSSDIECKINRELYKQEKQCPDILKSNQLSDYIKSLEKEAMNRKNKKVPKKNCKYQKGISLDLFEELENVLRETMKQVLELQIKMLKCITTGGISATSQEIEQDESMGEKSSNVGGAAEGFFLAGGALGGAGGGLGVASKGTESFSGFGGTNKSAETGMKLGPGATGGATGGAVGSVAAPPPVGRIDSGLEITTERTKKTDCIKRDRLDIEN